MSSLFFALSLLVTSTLALPTPPARRFPRLHDRLTTAEKRGLTGTIGLGDNSDLLYTVPIQLGSTTTVVNLDTGSSDLWVISSQCTTHTCAKTTTDTVRVPTKGLKMTGANVTMNYGDSLTGTYATGPIVQDTVSIAGLAIDNQAFAAISDTTNSVVEFGAAGIFGLGFPTESQVQGAVVTHQFGTTTATDHFVASSYSDGPLISRIAQTGQLEMPMFSISLQRSTIDISGVGALTLGSLPAGVDNSTITWAPVRLYSPAEGGINPPSFAPNEIYPLRWEIDLDGVFLDGKELAPSALPATGGVNSTRMSALIDTGNSILRGPTDVVGNILQTLSPTYIPSAASSSPVLPCTNAHNLTFQIGGKMFPIDPRDLVTPDAAGDATTCVANTITATDPPGVGALFRWSLGDPFFKSNLVVFHYGNLTHPSQDPPRIGFVSQVPNNAAALLAEAVSSAQANGGNFESTIVIAPTAAAEQAAEVTVVAVSASAEAAQLTDPVTATPTPTPTPTAAPAATSSVPNNAGTDVGSPAASPSASAGGSKTGAASRSLSSSSVVLAAAAALLCSLFAFV
ncbi:unnamed protein product [Mycena citricolor]|uniref:Peptidase A1 domain-containing protein n=1 Tax=Mycena citricolor TaxID=2018698 RepID=A0AAD2GY45_9AGAR|nr:unnamed protein product [Mycena citricolor]